MLLSFLTPWAFLGLIGIPLLIGIYWLRTRSRPVVISSLLLWQNPTEVKTGGLRFEALRTPLLFFLELLAILFLVLAAANPWLQTSLGSRSLVLILDDSYSMKAGGTESAKELALKELANRDFDREWSKIRVILAGANPQILGQSSSNLENVVQTVTQQWQCQSSQANLTQALAFALELEGDSADILVISDHAPEKEFSKRIVVRWWSFGKPLPNYAIVSAVRSVSDSKDRCVVEVANFSKEKIDTGLTIINPQKESENVPLSIAPGASQRLTLSWKRTKVFPGVVEARLPDDTLAIDNVVSLVPVMERRVRVQMDLANKELREQFKKVLDATTRAMIVKDRPDLLITDQADPSPSEQCWIFQVVREKEAVPFLGPFLGDQSHPLIRGLSYDGLIWGAGKAESLPGTPILLAGNVPLMSDEILLDGAHKIRMRYRPDLSTLTDRATWPILMWNLLEWRGSSLPGLQPGNIRLGETVTFTNPDGDGNVLVTTPANGTETVSLKDGKATYLANNVGLYSLLAKGESYPFSSNALSAEESDLREAVTGQWGEWRPPQTESGFQSVVWVALLLALLALVFHMYLLTQLGSNT